MSSQQAVLGTGAASARDDLVIVTVSWDGERFGVHDDKSARLVLPGRRQADVRRFSSHLGRFFREAGIQQLLVRGTSDSGRYRGNARRFAIETMLLLVPDVSTVIADPRSLTVWKNHSSDLLPRPSPELPLWERQLLADALVAACVACTGSPRPSWLAEMK